MARVFREAPRRDRANANTGSLISQERTREQQMAESHSASPLVLRHLVDTSKDRRIVLAVASNPNTTTEVLAEIYKRYADTDIVCAIASHVNTTGSMLEEISLRKELSIRMAVAMNWNTPDSVMEALSYDPRVVLTVNMIVQNLAEWCEIDSQHSNFRVGMNDAAKIQYEAAANALIRLNRHLKNSILRLSEPSEEMISEIQS